MDSIVILKIEPKWHQLILKLEFSGRPYMISLDKAECCDTPLISEYREFRDCFDEFKLYKYLSEKYQDFLCKKIKEKI